MKTSFFRIFLLATIFSLGFTSCVDDDDFYGYWVESYLDVDVSYTTNGRGDFSNSPIEYGFYDLGNVNSSRSDVSQIDLKDTWIEVSSQFRPGDILTLNISINGVGTFYCPTYYIADSRNTFIIDNTNAPGLYDFMSRAMSRMGYTGRMVISMNGNYNVNYTYLDIVLKNDLNVLVQDRW